MDKRAADDADTGSGEAKRRAVAAAEAPAAARAPGAAPLGSSVHAPAGDPAAAAAAAAVEREKTSETFVAPATILAAAPVKVIVRSLFASSDCGVIIGKGGANIKKVREESRANVMISEPGRPEQPRVCTLIGQRAEVVKAVGMISENVGLAKQAQAEQGGGTLAAEGVELTSTFKLLFPASQGSALIGKAGAVIAEIKESSQATVNIGEDKLEGSEESVCEISGTSAQVSAALAKIQEVLDASPVQGPCPQYVPAGSAPKQEARSRSQPPMQAPPPAYAQQFAMQQQMYGGGGAMQYGGYMPQYQQPGYAGAITSGNASGGANSSQQMMIPSEVAGSVIGKGGSVIKGIRDASGARVKIHDPEPGATERAIVCVGSAEQCTMAMQMIQQQLADAPAARGGGQPQQQQQAYQPPQAAQAYGQQQSAQAYSQQQPAYGQQQQPGMPATDAGFGVMRAQPQQPQYQQQQMYGGMQAYDQQQMAPQAAYAMPQQQQQYQAAYAQCAGHGAQPAAASAAPQPGAPAAAPPQQQAYGQQAPQQQMQAGAAPYDPAAAGQAAMYAPQAAGMYQPQ